MNKSELLTILAGKYDRVLNVDPRELVAGVQVYLANVLDVSGDTAIKANVGFYVIDEGQPGEIAYWMNAEPKPMPVVTFQAELSAYLDTQVGAGTIIFYNIVGTLPAINRAKVDVILDQAGTLIERTIGVWKNAQGDFNYQVITE